MRARVCVNVLLLGPITADMLVKGGRLGVNLKSQ